MTNRIITQINAFDKNIVGSLNGFFARHNNFLLKFFGEYLIYLLPLMLVALWFYSEKAKKVALAALFSAILAWPILANITGHLVHRARPFENGGFKELLFHRPTYSFPSDHAAALFAVAFSFWLAGYKKLSLSVFLMAMVISLARIAAGIHFPTDVLGGIAIGFLAAYLIYLFDKPLNFIYSFLIKLAHILRLA